MVATFATSPSARLDTSGKVMHEVPPGTHGHMCRCCATCYEAPCYGLKKDLQAKLLSGFV